MYGTVKALLGRVCSHTDSVPVYSLRVLVLRRLRPQLLSPHPAPTHVVGVQLSSCRQQRLIRDLKTRRTVVRTCHFK